MLQDIPAGEKSRDTTDSIEINPRALRAVTECMTVLPADGDEYTVVGQNGGGEYTVDARTGECSCPDATYNLSAHQRCKHSHRVAIVLGERPMPPVDPDDVDPHLGEHVDVERDDESPATSDAAPRRAVADGGIIVAGDNGEVLEDDGGECVDGEEWCPGPDADLDDELGPLPCFECYLAAKRREPAEWILAAREDAADGDAA